MTADNRLCCTLDDVTRAGTIPHLTGARSSLVALDNGTPDIQHTLVISFSASFTARTGGQYSIDESDLPPEMLSELAGMTVDAWGDYQVFIGGSVAGNFTATATLPLSVNLANADFTTSFYLGASFQLGGNLTSHLKATKNESSGSALDGTDEYERITITKDSPTTGYFGASFWLGFSSDDDANEGDAEEEGEYEAGESDGSNSPASDDVMPGNQSATDLVAQKKSGVQFSLAINGSSSTTDKANFESKNRTYGSDNDRYYEQILDKDNSTRTNEAHFRIEFGTEQMLIDFGISGSDSVDVEQELINWGHMHNSSMTEYQEVMTVSAFKRTAESHYNLGLVIGGDDPGLKSGGGFTVDEEARDEEHWPTGVYITTETFHNHGGDVESDAPKRHRRVQQYPTENGTGFSVDFDTPATDMSMSHLRRDCWNLLNCGRWTEDLGAEEHNWNRCCNTACPVDRGMAVIDWNRRYSSKGTFTANRKAARRNRKAQAIC